MTLQVRKRDGKLVEFEGYRIQRAIERAMQETDKGVDSLLAKAIAMDIQEKMGKYITPPTVEEVQDVVEHMLMKSDRTDVAKRYILYRSERAKKRKPKNTNRLLTDEFISQYKHRPNPFPNALGEFVYYRTYSRWLPEEERREYWWETVRRAVEYNCSLSPTTTRREAEELFDNIYNLRQFLSGRTFWVGGTDVARNYPLANFNCAFQKIERFEDFKDLFYLLMVGAGVGVRVLKEDVEKLPLIRTNVEVIHKAYTPVKKKDRQDSTSIMFEDDMVEIVIGDSKEGWVQSLDFYLKILYSNEYRKITTVIFNYDHVRPKGEKLKTFGGTASGHQSLKNMFTKIARLLDKKEDERTQLKPIDCLDIANIIGENVVVGGVRRTAEIGLIDADDMECIEAKSNLYKQVDGQWIIDQDIIHRQMSNNSIYYKVKPTRERLNWQIQQMRFSGEPAWVNGEMGAKRRDNMNGVNPCGEILLDSKGTCNLTTLNCMAFVINGKLDIDGILQAQRMSARAGYRMTLVELELPQWSATQKRDRLVGTSLTGYQDMVNAVGMTIEQQKKFLELMRDVANQECQKYAKELGLNAPILVTTVKPEGTLSQLPVVSSGVHYSHSPYYIRRVRINSDDPLVKVAEELGWEVTPENGQDWDTCNTKVIAFPVEAPQGRTKYDVSAIEQLENYLMFQEFYTDHNTSITVHVRDHEWEEVEEFIWEHWDRIMAVSFLSLTDHFYAQAPYEAISKEEYDRRKAEMKLFNPALLKKYEKEEVEVDIGTESCESGVCPIR